MGGLREGRAAAHQIDGDWTLAHGLSDDGDPQGGVERLRGTCVDVVTEEVKATTERLVEPWGVGKRGEQDAVASDQLGVVVIDHQHVIEMARQRLNLLLTGD